MSSEVDIDGKQTITNYLSEAPKNSKNNAFTLGAVAVLSVLAIVLTLFLALPEEDKPDRYEAPFYIETTFGDYYAVSYQVVGDGLLVLQKYSNKVMQGVIVVVEGPWNVNLRLPESQIPQFTSTPEE